MRSLSVKPQEEIGRRKLSFGDHRQGEGHRAMLISIANASRTWIDPKVMSRPIWDDIQRLYVDWDNAVRIQDLTDAAAAEQELRFFGLHFASLPIGDDVTTGRKTILRSIYTRFGNFDTAHVISMLDAVIAREEAAPAVGEGDVPGVDVAVEAQTADTLQRAEAPPAAARVRAAASEGAAPGAGRPGCSPRKGAS